VLGALPTYEIGDCPARGPRTEKPAKSAKSRPDSEGDAALDEIRTGYGPTAITRGILLGRRTAPDMPMLPD
jgi:hypothetical protein